MAETYSNGRHRNRLKQNPQSGAASILSSSCSENISLQSSPAEIKFDMYTSRVFRQSTSPMLQQLLDRTIHYSPLMDGKCTSTIIPLGYLRLAKLSLHNSS